MLRAKRVGPSLNVDRMLRIDDGDSEGASDSEESIEDNSDVEFDAARCRSDTAVTPSPSLLVTTPTSSKVLTWVEVLTIFMLLNQWEP